MFFDSGDDAGRELDVGRFAHEILDQFQFVQSAKPSMISGVLETLFPCCSRILRLWTLKTASVSVTCMSLVGGTGRRMPEVSL
jgi:hypothetical protein